MGARLINWATRSHYSKQAGVPAAAAYRCEVLYDGVDARPWSPHLPAAEIWIDGTALYRQGINLGASIQTFADSGTVAIYGMVADRGYITHILKPGAEYASLATILSTKWTTIDATAANSEIITPNGTTWDIFRLVFTVGAPAAVVFASL